MRSSKENLVSFIIPAHNESQELSQTLSAIHSAMREAGKPYELLVVDDASTDNTASLAIEKGARVIKVNHRQISATRNSGAREARGTWFFFIDADTRVTAAAIQSGLKAMDGGAAGGGACTRLEGEVPAYARLIFLLLYVGGKIVGATGGAFMFCTREAFYSTGGFSEQVYAAEETGFAMALKQMGPFVVLWERVGTSGRRFRVIPGLKILFIFIRMIVFPGRVLRNRATVQNIWYSSDRSKDNQTIRSLRFHASNAAALFLILVVFAGPLWNFIPWPEALFRDLSGTLRVLIGLILISAGLLLWPCALYLLKILPRQNRWPEKLKLSALIVFCVVKACGSTKALLGFFLLVYKAARF